MRSWNNDNHKNNHSLPYSNVGPAHETTRLLSDRITDDNQEVTARTVEETQSLIFRQDSNQKNNEQPYSGQINDEDCCTFVGKNMSPTLLLYNTFISVFKVCATVILVWYALMLLNDATSKPITATKLNDETNHKNFDPSTTDTPLFAVQDKNADNFIDTLKFSYYNKAIGASNSADGNISQNNIPKSNNNANKKDNTGNDDTPYTFPSDFSWGVATSSYQVEGAFDKDGRGKSIWDFYCHQNDHNSNKKNSTSPIMDGSSGDVACDHYHRFLSDIQILKDTLNVPAYRLSISWPRILPNGTGHINMAGISFYRTLLSVLRENNIVPWVTLYHWDLPQTLQSEYGGWTNRSTVDAFVKYAQVCFDAFGDLVDRWITINEGWTVAVNGYATGVHAPGIQDATLPYVVAHHLLLAHAQTVHLYKTKYASKYSSYGSSLTTTATATSRTARTENDNLSSTKVRANDGQIGISNCGDFRYPKNSSSTADIIAADRAILFQWGWFTEPLVYGDYPSVLREQLGHRLPKFTTEEKALLKGSFDFLGLNYYSSLLAAEPKHKPNYDGYYADINVDFSTDPSWSLNDMGWSVVPEGLYVMLLWIAERYGHPVVVITENGTAEHEPDVETAIKDTKRESFIHQHIAAVGHAVTYDNITVAGYFAWSLMDNFEWQFGYQRRFGLCYVDFNTLVRTPKGSALFYSDTIAKHGRNVNRLVDRHIVDEQKERRENDVSIYRNDTQHRILHTRVRKRALPIRILMGYGSNVTKVKQAIYNGVNVVVWAFVDIVLVQHHVQVKTNLNLENIRQLKTELESEGYGHVLHIASIGGWNGPHLSTDLEAVDWYYGFKYFLGEIFDGIDWDLEGNDDLKSATNIFTIECLDKIGQISELAKLDGYIISMAPPQSYLDIDNNNFSRLVNLSAPSRHWHDEFEYYGENVYAYILARYGQYIDLVSMQFYESYSRAVQAVVVDNMSAAEYIVAYVQQLQHMHEEWLVKFAEDGTVGLDDQYVQMPMTKLLIGLGNGWTLNDHDKHFYASVDQIDDAWSQLQDLNLNTVRGFMFWTIDDEGLHDITLATGLSKILGLQLVSAVAEVQK